jgi:GATA-binding protein
MQDVQLLIQSLILDRPVRPVVQNTPSGIAQLRKDSENNLNVNNSADSMNLDDFIFSENAATPAGIASPHMNITDHPFKAPEEKPATSQAGAIPIKSRKDGGSHFVPQSVPVPPHHQGQNNEFNYVNRHLRKTSIDERQVSDPPIPKRRVKAQKPPIPASSQRAQRPPRTFNR